MSPPIKTLLAAGLLLTTLAYLRPPEYDESYSLFLTAAHARPAWPTAIFTPASVRHFYTGPSTFPQIAHDLRAGDVHPPLYFWLLKLWRDLFGPAWLTARLLSVLITLATLATLSRLAKLTGTPAASTLFLCLLTYAFAYTAILARGFALAQFLLLLGVTLSRHSIAGVVSPSRNPSVTPSPPSSNRHTPALAGLVLGAATFTNYLTLFTALTTLAFLAKHAPQRAIPAVLAFTLFLPPDAYIFAAQHTARPAQFAPFTLAHALPLLAKDSAAAWFGGLPLYAPSFAPEITAALIALAATTIVFIAKHPTPHTIPLAALTLSTPIGLLALGLIFHNTPIEIRYLSFSLPYLSLLTAAAAPKPLQAALIAVQSLAIAGLALSPITAQPQAAAAHQAAALATPQTLVLLPFGNDGVGIPGPFIASSHNAMNILLLHPNAPPNLTQQTTILLATLTLDGGSRLTVAQTIANLATQPCWRPETTTPLLRQYRNICAPHGPPINHPTD